MSSAARALRNGTDPAEIMTSIAGVNPMRMGAAEHLGLALLLGAAMFAAAGLSLAYVDQQGRTASFWLANGIALAALLRTPRPAWPLLILCAFTGNLAAGLTFRSSPLLPQLIVAASNLAQYGLVALVLRARVGAFFDLLDRTHVAWLCILSIPGTLLKGLILWSIPEITNYPVMLPSQVITWFASSTLSLFVLSLPLLALTCPPDQSRLRFDSLAYGLIALLIVLTYLIFGPPQLPMLFIIMPPLMLLAWRYGPLGAGVGALLINATGAALTILTPGIVVRLSGDGYSASEIGIVLELFFSVTILISIPVAVARARQMKTDAALATALVSAERRATQLAESEAAIRASKKVLEQSEARFRSIFERAPLGIAVLDAETHLFLDANPKFLQITGWPHATLLTKTWQDTFAPDRLDDQSRKASRFKETASFQTEKSYARPDGTIVWVNLAVTRIAMPGSNREHFLAMAEDITERKALQYRLDLVQRLDAIGQLTGGIAHDFNNLLTVIIGSAETLGEELDAPEQRELAGLILDTAERAGELTAHLLAFARRQPLSPRSHDINALLNSSEALIRRTFGANLRLTIERAANARRVYADRAQTEAAILNLCLNARDAMPEGGRLTISTGNVNIDDEFIRGHSGVSPGDYVFVRVSDTGTGIAPDVLDRIFEPFFTTKGPGNGTGLGLAMVYGFAKQSQGHIDVESQLGTGSTFTLYLPIGQAEEDDAETAAVNNLPRGSETVLLVEDDDLVRSHAQGQLTSLGYQVLEASDGPEALAWFEQRNDIALLFTDMMMPGGLNGRELAERARELRPHIRILFSSGCADEMLTADGSLADGVSQLAKPYARRQLAEKVRKALDGAA